MNNALKLKDWTVQKVTEQATQSIVAASYDIAPMSCPHCGCVANVKKHGARQQRISDVPAFGKATVIDVNRLRYWCKDCGKTFLQPLPDLADSGSMTTRLRSYIERQSLKHTFAHVAEEVGIDEKSVRNIFNAYTDWLDKTVVFETPEVLGLDELFLLGKARCVAVNIVEATLIGVMEDRNKPTVHEFLFWLRDKEKVKVVTMDMWKPYRDAVHACLPWARIVVDKFHIVRMATQAMDGVRKRLRDELTATKRREVMRSRFLTFKRNRDLNDGQKQLLAEWSESLPTLGAAYRLKESYYDIFDLTRRADAVEAYRKWELDMPDAMRPAFKDLTTAMTNWHEEVFDIIEYGVSNAVTEAINGLSKMTNRQGRGYSFRAIRAKMLFNKHVQWTHERKMESEQAMRDMELLHMNVKDSESADSPYGDGAEERLDDLIMRDDSIPQRGYGALIDYLSSVLIDEEESAASPPQPTPKGLATKAKKKH